MPLRKKQSIDSHVQDLKAQATATRAAAKEITNHEEKALVVKGADTLAALAQSRALTNKPGYVLQLPDTATSSDINDHRRRRSVRCGDDVYLPNWHDSAVLFPNLFLRSSLFSASDPGTMLNNHILGTLGDTRIEMTGPQLGYYDRRVFGACLKHYQAERALASDSDGHWISTTFWQLAKMMGSFNQNAPLAIRNSLKRLEAATLRIKHKGYDLPVPRLVEVAFDHGCTDMVTPGDQLKGAGKVVFRIQDSMATLFGIYQWTAVSDRTLHDHEGLAAWICSFYASHKEPYELNIKHLHSLAGAKPGLAEFRKRLRSALTKLQTADTADEHRVARFDMTKDKLTVHLAHWPGPPRKTRANPID